MSRVVVIRAGEMEPAAACQALLDGHTVDIVKASPEPGGLAGYFDFGGISLERLYRFVCRNDQPTFEMLAELGLADKVRWTRPRMGSFNQGPPHAGPNRRPHTLRPCQ